MTKNYRLNDYLASSAPDPSPDDEVQEISKVDQNYLLEKAKEVLGELDKFTVLTVGDLLFGTPPAHREWASENLEVTFDVRRCDDPEPTVLVWMEGGVVQSIVTTGGIKVEIFNYEDESDTLRWAKAMEELGDDAKEYFE